MTRKKKEGKSVLIGCWAPLWTLPPYRIEKWKGLHGKEEIEEVIGNNDEIYKVFNHFLSDLNNIGISVSEAYPELSKEVLFRTKCMKMFLDAFEERERVSETSYFDLESKYKRLIRGTSIDQHYFSSGSSESCTDSQVDKSLKDAKQIIKLKDRINLLESRYSEINSRRVESVLNSPVEDLENENQGMENMDDLEIGNKQTEWIDDIRKISKCLYDQGLCKKLNDRLDLISSSIQLGELRKITSGINRYEDIERQSRDLKDEILCLNKQIDSLKNQSAYQSDKEDIRDLRNRYKDQEKELKLVKEKLDKVYVFMEDFSKKKVGYSNESSGFQDEVGYPTSGKRAEDREDAAESWKANKEVNIEWRNVIGRKAKTVTAKVEPTDRSKNKISIVSDRSKKSFRSEVILIKGNHKDFSYSSELKKVREKLIEEKELIENIRIRRADSGAYKLEVFGSNKEKKAKELKGKVADILNGTATVTRPRSQGRLRVWGLDVTVSAEEIVEYLGTKVNCDKSEFSTGRIFYNREGMGTLYIQCPLSIAYKSVQDSKLKLEWCWVNIEMTEIVPLQCFKCWHYGHVATECKSGFSRTGYCFRCGEKGHVTKDCVNKVKCVICEDTCAESDHRMGSNTCVTRLEYNNYIRSNNCNSFSCSSFKGESSGSSKLTNSCSNLTKKEDSFSKDLSLTERFEESSLNDTQSNSTQY